jgi:F-type H+-transporting ATPase subunit b
MEFFTEPKTWVAVATILFFVAAFRPAKKALLGMIDARTAEITRTLEQASKLKDEAQILLENIQRKNSKSQQEADAIINQAKQEAEAIITEANQKLAQDIENRKKMALQKIASLQEVATTEIKTHITNLTIEVSRKLLVDNIDGNVSKNIVSNSIEKLSKTLH